MGLLGTLLLPARLTLRALDDVHTLADGVRTLAAREFELRRGARRIDAALADLDALADGGRELRAREGELRQAGRRVDGALDDLHALAEGAGAAPDADTGRELVRAADARTAAMLAVETALVEVLEPLVDRLVRLDEALPPAPRAIEIVDELRDAVTTLAATAER